MVNVDVTAKILKNITYIKKIINGILLYVFVKKKKTIEETKTVSKRSFFVQVLTKKR